MSGKKTKNYTIGLDIGGTAIKGILFDGEKAVADHELATPRDNLGHFLVMLKAVADPLAERAEQLKVKVSGIGVGIAGVMDSKAEKMLMSPNLKFLNNINLSQKIGSLFAMPVLIDNDAKCFVRAEAMIGAGRGRDNVYGLIIGTGIGGGWWHNGGVYAGAHRGASEVDAMIVDISSGLNLEEGYHQIMQRNPEKISEEAMVGDPLAEKIFEEFGRQLGAAMSNIANIIDPEMFILGGGAIASADLFLSIAKREMKKHINSTEAARKIKIAKSKLGKHAGAIGAALLVYAH